MLNRTMIIVVRHQEKKKTEENHKVSESSPLEILLRNTTSGLHDLALSTIHAESVDSSSGSELQRNTMSANAKEAFVRKFGVITYSDEISLDFTKCRILILERGLVCKTKTEKFIDQVFSIPILNIELHENDIYPRKMRIITGNSTHINYTVTFSTKQFMDAILTQRNSSDHRYCNDKS
ncbi:uncharacterized protein LOC116348094 isoform X2 [Contarinia nasturtii]|uniref:uncharacterized protein LOC116348094 isoform X2 n=1 Tax=Contarinia nasturtii TaxID=265458 RepID=UPI0012D427D3|nr:uncharacterized protein LOC116348094 isoform X2 [Contarinia nasturtii]